MVTHRGMWRTGAFDIELPVPPETVVCPDLICLAIVINRTGRATFELCSGEPRLEPSHGEVGSFINSVDKNWLSRCRSLVVLPHKYNMLRPDRLGLLFHSCNMNALETF